MRQMRWAGLTAGFVAVATIAFPGQAFAQHTGVEIWSAVCGRCHTVQPPERYTPKDWTSIVGHMTVNARLTDAESAAVLAFLLQGAMRTDAPPQQAQAEAPRGEHVQGGRDDEIEGVGPTGGLEEELQVRRSAPQIPEKSARVSDPSGAN